MHTMLQDLITSTEVFFAGNRQIFRSKQSENIILSRKMSLPKPGLILTTFWLQVPYTTR